MIKKVPTRSFFLIPSSEEKENACVLLGRATTEQELNTAPLAAQLSKFVTLRVQILLRVLIAIISILCALSIPLSFAEASGTLAVQSLSPSGGSVYVNVPVTLSLVQSGLSSPTYSVYDEAGAYVPNVTSQGNFSWTPGTSAVGTHNLIFTATDSGGNSATVSQAITVSSPTASLSSMTNGPAAYVGMPMSFQITTVGFTNPTYWLGDSVGATTLTNSKLNSSGAFFWVPQTSDIGTHKMMINVADQFGHAMDLSQDITVSPAPTPQVTALTPGTTTPAGIQVSFTVTSPGFTTPTFAVQDSYSPSSVTSDNLSSSGVFTWTPAMSQTGTHNILILITGSNGQIAKILQPIVVLTPLLSISNVVPGDTVSVGSPLQFNVNYSGLSSPTYGITDAYPGTVSTNNMSSSGLFIWTPTSGDVGQHNIGVHAVDSYGNAATVYKDIKVVPQSTVIPPTAISTPTVAPQTAQSPSGYYFGRSLAVGSVGADVTALQGLLVKLGFLATTPTGTFGPMTLAAVQKFQSANGISPVGAVGPATRAKLNATGGGVSAGTGATGTYRFTTPLAFGASGTEVTELQKKLATLGFFVGAPTGTFDTPTVVAVKKFQAAKGLEQVGGVGPATRAALNAS